MNDRLDEEAVEWERKKDKEVDSWAEAATDDAYEHMAWFTGRRIAVTRPEPQYVDTGMGFKVRDRRGASSH